MLKPDFLPFRSTEFTREQALQAGVYIVSLDIASPGASQIDVYQELTGREKSIGDSVGMVQIGIVSKVARELNLYIGVGRKFDATGLISSYNSRLLLS
jgi:hypothetical protein